MKKSNNKRIRLTNILSSFGVVAILVLSSGAMTAMAAGKSNEGPMSWSDFSSEVDVVESEAVDNAASGGIGMHSLWELD